MLNGMRDLLLLCLLLIFATQSVVAQTPSNGRFVGNLVLRDLAGPDGLKFELVEPFGFIDPQGVRWQATKGSITDGASIPQIFWSVVGGPFSGAYRRAAVIHDFYCDNNYRTWERTHRAFYDAMITAGVTKAKANLMYFAVWRFGPRWSAEALVPCKPGPGQYCDSARPESIVVKKHAAKLSEQEVSEAKAELAKIGDRFEGLSLEQIEGIAEAFSPTPRATTIHEIDGSLDRRFDDLKFLFSTGK